MQDWCKRAVHFVVNILISPITLVLSLILGINILRRKLKKLKEEA